MGKSKKKNNMKNGNLNIFHSLSEKLEAVVAEPTKFLRTQPEKYNDIKELLRSTYRTSVKSDNHNKTSASILTELIVKGMEEEQIWQQLELRNNVVFPQFIERVSQLLALRETKFEIRLKEENEDEEIGQEEEDDDYDEELARNGGEDDEDGLNEEEEDEEDDNKALNGSQKKPKKLRSSVVDDKFFKLGEMEAFLEAEDEKEMRKQKLKTFDDDDDGIDYFAEDLGDEDDAEEDDEVNANYKDFFQADENEQSQEDELEKEDEDDDLEGNEEIFEKADDSSHELEESISTTPKKKNKSKNVDANEKEEASETESSHNSEDDSENNSVKEDEKPKSSFEMRQERLLHRIRDYEDEVLGEKPWQLKGEIQASNRPQNSLLEEILEFEASVRPAPVITEETTQRLEDIIRQRIKDRAWDDVVPQVRPVQTPQDYRKQLILDQEKSKQSLAQIYEKDYQRELDKLDPNRNDNEAEEEPKEHQEIKRLMDGLFKKLDALFNSHFVPKPVAPEPKIITNTPALAMEEVAPVAVSDVNLLAPEEVYRGPKHELLGKSERNRTDKNRERRKKKQKQKAVHKALEEKDKLRQKQGIPLTKKAENAKLLKSLTKQRNVEKLTTSADKSSLKSSKAFFSKLQDTTSNSQVRGGKKKADPIKTTAKRLKL